MGKRQRKGLRYEDELKIRLGVLKILRKRGSTPELRRILANEIGVGERTIRRWEQRVRDGKPVYAKRGRKTADVPRARRQK